jgi:hypothetical protein
VKRDKKQRGIKPTDYRALVTWKFKRHVGAFWPAIVARGLAEDLMQELRLAELLAVRLGLDTVDTLRLADRAIYRALRNMGFPYRQAVTRANKRPVSA